MCEGGFCVTAEVTVQGAGAEWSGGVYDFDVGTRWTFETSADGDGVATLGVDGGASVTVALASAGSVSVAGPAGALDGAGELTPDEATALQGLLDDPDLLAGLSRVPLELGCSDTVVEPAAMAALLAPWQVVLKYAEENRISEVRRLAGESRCDWFPEPTSATPDRKPPTGAFLLGREAPIPVVVGWLPVDAVGDLAQAPRAAGDRWGPCGALCRGTCGIDCPWVNCNRDEIEWCEQVHGQGGNTGWLYEAVELDCGTATGCVNHDDCYDRCNATNGCGTWAALSCRSGSGGCDEVACLTHGVDNCAAWAAGLGPYEGRITYVFPPNTPGLGVEGVEDTETCPVDDGTLQWEVSPPTAAQANALAADAYCANLTLDGHDDWRLPEFFELETIEVGCPIKDCLDISVYGVPFCVGCAEGDGPGAGGCYLDPRLTGPCDTYWSATPYEDFPGDPLPGRYVWSARWGNEYVQSSQTYSNYYVRCVRP